MTIYFFLHVFRSSLKIIIIFICELIHKILIITILNCDIYCSVYIFSYTKIIFCMNYTILYIGEESLNAYKYNEEKALKWLEKKVRRVADALKDKGYHVSSQRVISANFLTNKDDVESEGNLVL